MTGAVPCHEPEANEARSQPTPHRSNQSDNAAPCGYAALGWSASTWRLQIGLNNLPGITSIPATQPLSKRPLRGLNTSVQVEALCRRIHPRSLSPTALHEWTSMEEVAMSSRTWLSNIQFRRALRDDAVLSIKRIVRELARYLAGSPDSRLRQGATLRTLDDRLLADIGVSRRDVLRFKMFRGGEEDRRSYRRKLVSTDSG